MSEPGFLCSSADLEEAGKGVRFTIRLNDVEHPGFLIRFQGKARAYLNECAHQAVELDWEPGEFFDLPRKHLICATHGALYDPASGACISGRCGRRGLTALGVSENSTGIFLMAENGLNLIEVES